MKIDDEEKKDCEIVLKSDPQTVLDVWEGCFCSQNSRRRKPFEFDVPDIYDSVPEGLGAEIIDNYDDCMEEARLEVHLFHKNVFA